MELTAQQVALRLGVKRETVYAYVSRGALISRPGRDRTSRFDADEVEALARRGRPRRASRSPVFEIQIDSGITAIERDSLRYAGHDALRLATTATFEQVATLCWTGRLPRHPPHWSGTAVAVPDRGDLLERVRVIVALAALDDSDHGARGEHGDHGEPGDLRPAAVVPRAATLIATVVDNLPVVGDGRAPRLRLGEGPPLRGTIAGRLWARLARRRATPELLAALNAALVLLTDHELATSTFAARLAASVRADVPAVVSCGLGPLAGPLHGRASAAARTLLDTALHGGGPAVAVAAALRTHGRVPAFGHPLYPDGDPRARALLGLLRRAAPDSRALAAVDGVVATVQQRVPVQPNVDFALAALGLVAAMPPDAGDGLFAVARMAGWVAHALEEYGETPLRFRPRAHFVGVA